MDVELLQQADVILSKCGRPSLRGASAVPLTRYIPMPMVLQPNQTTTFIREIPGDTAFRLMAISSSVGSVGDSLTGVRIQIQLPSGRFLFGGKNGIDVGQFAWIGSWRYLMDPDEDCEPGSKFRVTLVDAIGLGAAYAVNLVFEGADIYYLKGGPTNSPQQASSIPRYQGTVNENILAPCYTAGLGPPTPPGYDDELFTYASPTATVTVGSSTITASLRITIDAGLDFLCRRMLFDVIAPDTVTAATWLGRLRLGTGYGLSDSYIDLAQYLGGAEFPVDWKITGGDQVNIDVTLADAAGAGDVSLTVYLEGVRRRKT